MCTAVAMAYSEVPLHLAEQYPRLIADRHGSRELRCSVIDRPPLIPVWWHGEIKMLQWGNRDRRSSLPYGHTVTQEWIRSGALDWARPEKCVSPVQMALDRRTWYLVNEGLFVAVLPDVAGGPVAYILTEPSSYYYRNMTQQNPRMPVFVGQVI